MPSVQVTSTSHFSTPRARYPACTIVACSPLRSCKKAMLASSTGSRWNGEPIQRADRLDLRVEHPAGPIDHVRAVHQPHAAAGRAVEEPRQAALDAEGLVPGVGGEDRLAERAVLDELARANGGGEVALAVGHQQVHAAALDGGEHAVALFERVGHRLFEKDVLAGRRRGDGGLLVQKVGQRDHHQLDVVALEDRRRGSVKARQPWRLGEGVGALASASKTATSWAPAVSAMARAWPWPARPAPKIATPRSALGVALGHTRAKCSNGGRIHLL